jgi:hypothetical protein
MKNLLGIFYFLYGIGAFGTFNYIFFFSNHAFLDGPLAASGGITMFLTVIWPFYWLYLLF